MVEFLWEEIGPLWEANDCDLWVAEATKYSRWDVTWFRM